MHNIGPHVNTDLIDVLHRWSSLTLCGAKRERVQTDLSRNVRTLDPKTRAFVHSRAEIDIIVDITPPFALLYLISPVRRGTHIGKFTISIAYVFARI